MKKKVIKISKKQMLLSAVFQQLKEQQELATALNEQLLNSMTIKELKKIHKLNEVALSLMKSLDIKELKSIVKSGLSVIN